MLVGIPQGFILGPLFFLIYINKLPEGLKSNIRLFVDDTSLFSVIKNKAESASDLTNDPKKNPKKPRKRYYSLEKTHI